MEYTIVVAVRDVEGAKQFLMAKHRERGWELPGGKLEAKEGPVRCALREFREETGHMLLDPKYVFRLEKENGLCHVFTGQIGEAVGVVGDDEVIVETAWFDKLPEGELAFPNDPYEKIGDALGIQFRGPTS